MASSIKDISADELLELAYQHRTKDLPQVKYYLHQLEVNSFTLTADQADFQNFLNGYVLFMEGKTALATRLFEQIKNSSYLRVKVLSRLLLALCYRDNSSNFSKSFELLFSVTELLPQVKDRNLKSSIYTVAATMHQTVSQPELAMEYAHKGLKTASTPKWQCMFGGILLQVENRPSSALFENTLKSCEEAAEKILALNARLWFAQKLIKEKPRWVYQFLLPHLGESEQQGYTMQQIGIKALLGEASLHQNQLVEAEKYLLQANAQLSTLSDFETQNLVFNSLALLYQKQGKPEKSAEFYRLSYENSQRQRKIDLENALAYQVAKTNAIIDQQKADALETELRLFQSEAATQKLYVAIAILIAILVLVLGGALSWFLYHRGSRHKHLSITDCLTGAYNRRYFDHELQTLLCSKGDVIHSLIIFDLDWFKQVNDKYGHAAGDLVLVEVTQVARRQGRQGDHLARIGGEEFAMILEECPLIQAGLIAEQIREAIEQLNFDEHYSGLKVAASLGVSSSELAQGQLDRLLKQADQALYQSKERGRNLVTLYSNATPQAPHS